ncbi:MAG TPA: hypothetical protein VFA52_01785 [Candidatus Paceibacterota bacterium]|nr:hypothetical protein [Candidatus Paceibacterota bacterium]
MIKPILHDLSQIEEKPVLYSEAHWIDIFRQKGAWWQHDGNPKRPHALLTNGDHSDGFFNCGLVLEDALVVEEISRDLVGKLCLKGYKNNVYSEKPHYVVGPAMGAIVLAYAVALELQRTWIPSLVDNPFVWRSVFTEKEEPSEMVFKRIVPPRGSVALPIEDTITTSKSVGKTISACEQAGMEVLPYVLAVLNRSDLMTVGQGNGQIVALVTKRMNNWSPAECPLCKKGSKALRPKTPASNWDLLTATY